MHRRAFLQSIIAGGASLSCVNRAHAALADMKIKRIRFYQSPQSRPIFNQSFHVVEVETDAGITGIGEGGSVDTIKQCAGLLIGQSPLRIEHLWQRMYRGFFYPPGREKLHALGALDLALWDIKGKALDIPVYELLGGLTRQRLDCYATGFPGVGGPEEQARACIDAGFRAFRTSVTGGVANGRFDSKKSVRLTHQLCRQIRQGVGDNGEWAIDYHTRLDMPDAIRLSTLIEDLEPVFVEDLVRSENPSVYEQLRPQVKVPIAVGEHFGDRWDINELVEQRLIDYSRVSLPNAGGITEFMKIAAICETHYVGLIPHFTGPISTAALVHACGAFPGPAMMEMTNGGRTRYAYLPHSYDFRDGSLWPNQRPGIGVEVDTRQLDLAAEIDGPSQPIPLYYRPDGSITNW
jgi:galactonate dehydratase